MYAWELQSANTQTFRAGQLVQLNPDWSGYGYLKREFSKVFPRYVRKCSDGVVQLEDSKLTFATQCLTARRV